MPRSSASGSSGTSGGNASSPRQVFALTQRNAVVDRGTCLRRDAGRDTVGVQIVEANDAGVRVAELVLRRRDSPLQFVVYPMLHVGTRDFYQELTRRLARADVVVTEGVGPSKAAASLTSSYRAMADDLRLRLIVQNIDYRSLPGQVICPDIPRTGGCCRHWTTSTSSGRANPSPWP